MQANDPTRSHVSEQELEPLAVAGFVLAFGATLIGLVISIFALRRIHVSGRKGAGLAWAGVVISSLATLLGATFLIIMASRGELNFLFD